MSPTDDLRVPPGPGAPGGLVVPAAELTQRFSRASGPGGQGVNTTDSRVQLSLDLTTTTALSPAQRDRALKALATRLADGVLTLDAAEHRSQRRNRAAARERLATLLRDAVTPGAASRHPPHARLATAPAGGQTPTRTDQGAARPPDGGVRAPPGDLRPSPLA